MNRTFSTTQVARIRVRGGGDPDFFSKFSKWLTENGIQTLRVTTSTSEYVFEFSPKDAKEVKTRLLDQGIKQAD